MANRSQKLGAFHGGINDNSDARDISEEELAEAIDCAVNRVGRVTVIGAEGTALTALAPADIKPLKGRGMFYFSSDADKDSKENSEDWIVIYNQADGKIMFYYRDKPNGDTTPAIGTSTDMYDSWISNSLDYANALPAFYLADGALRYCDGNFSAYTKNKIRHFVDNRLFQRKSANTTIVKPCLITKYRHWITSAASNNAFANVVTGMTVVQSEFGDGIPVGTVVTDIVTESVDPHRVYMSNSVTLDAGFVGNNTTIVADCTFTLDAIVTRKAWVTHEQELKSFKDFGTTLTLDDSSTEGPDDTALGSSSGNIILSYWTGKGDDGDWNGSFQFAASPIYKMGGVGPISEFSGVTNFHNDMVSFQLHISMSGTIDDDAHPFGDDRIDGTRVWFRSHGADKWHKLKDFDLKKGGKHRWETYDGATNKAYGIFNGSITSPSVVEDDKKSYKEVDMSFTITNSANGFSGRKGFIRVWGVYNEPQWLNAYNGNPIDLSATSQAYTMEVTMPGVGDREFRVELLDESFNVIKKSSKTSISITESGDKPPPTYSDSTDSS